MRRLLRRLLLALLLIVIAAVGWFLCWAWPVFRYQNIHHAIRDRTSLARLQLLARQTVPIANTLKPADGYINYQKLDTTHAIPAEIRDLDPTDITIESDSVTVNLCGGWCQYGFRIERTKRDRHLWVIYRYDETDDIKAGMYRDNETQ